VRIEGFVPPAPAPEPAPLALILTGLFFLAASASRRALAAR
jgi:hypothetical protein